MGIKESLGNFGAKIGAMGARVDKEYYHNDYPGIWKGYPGKIKDRIIEEIEAERSIAKGFRFFTDSQVATTPLLKIANTPVIEISAFTTYAYRRIRREKAHEITTKEISIMEDAEIQPSLSTENADKE